MVILLVPQGLSLIAIQKHCKREQNHQACLNVMPSAALFYAKIQHSDLEFPNLSE
jgi:hypothetical protein